MDRALLDMRCRWRRPASCATSSTTWARSSPPPRPMPRGRRGGADPAPGRGRQVTLKTVAAQLGIRRARSSGGWSPKGAWRAVGYGGSFERAQRCCAAGRSAWRRSRARSATATRPTSAARSGASSARRPAPSRPPAAAALHPSPRDRMTQATDDTATAAPPLPRTAPLRRYADCLAARPALVGQRCRSSRRASTCSSRTGAASSPYFKLRVAGRHIPRRRRPRGRGRGAARPAEGFARTSRLEIWTEMGFAPGVFGANGEIWRCQRRMVMAGFDPAHVRRYHPSLLAVATRLARRWDRAAQAGTAIDLQADLMRYTVDTIAAPPLRRRGQHARVRRRPHPAAPGQDLPGAVPAHPRRCRCGASGARRRTGRSSAASPRCAPRWTASSPRRGRGRRAELREHPTNLLEAMLAAADEPGSGIDDAQVAGNVLTMLLAGEDTTANTPGLGDPPAVAASAELARATEGGAAACPIRCRRRWSSSRSSTTSRPAPTRRCA